MPATGDTRVLRVEATVHEEQHHRQAYERRELAAGRTPRGRQIAAPGRVMLIVVLSAVLEDGRRVEAANATGVAGVPPLALSGIREHLDIVLGKVAEPRPSPLAWGPLIAALEGAGLSVSESDLAALPLAIGVHESAQALVALD